MSEEQNEVLKQQRYLLECRMYRLDPAPPKLPAQEYIVRYLTEKEEKYLAWYLHDQEPALKKLAQGYSYVEDAGGHALTDADTVQIGEALSIHLYRGSLKAAVTEIRKQDAAEDGLEKGRIDG